MYREAFPDQAMQVPTRSKDTDHAVILVGSSLMFTEQMMRVVTTEFSGTLLIRAKDLSELHLVMQVREDVAMVVIDEAMSDDVRDYFDSWSGTCGTAQMVLAYKNDDHALRLLNARFENAALRSLAFLPMNRPLDVWLNLLRVLISGEVLLPSELLGASQNARTAEATPTPMADTPKTQEVPHQVQLLAEGGLTAREQQVLAVVAKGKQNKLIAAELGLSEHTVKLHIHNVIKKLGVANRTEASAWFHATLSQHPSAPQ